MANGGDYEDTTSETINLLSENEDDDQPSTGVNWPQLKEHKKVILYQWTGLSKKPSFLKKMTKGGKEEKKALVSKVKKAKIHQTKMESFTHRRSNKAVLCPLVCNLPENRHGPEWASLKSYFMPEILEVSEPLHMEEASQLESETEYLHLSSKVDQHRAAQVQLELEKSDHLISAEIAHLQLLELKQGHNSNQLYLCNEEVDDENVDPQSVDGLQNPSTHLTYSQEPASDACTVQDIAPYFYDRDSTLAMIPSSAFVETSGLVGGIPITGSLDRKCCNTEPLMKEITAVKNRQDLLEKECLQLRSRYHADNNIIMELLREQHLRYSQLVVNVNDLREQQNAEIVNMKEVILFMEEKMAYQSYEQARDIWDELGLFQSRLLKIEVEQKQQNNPASENEANSSQILYSIVMNLLPIIVTKTSQILCGKVMMKYLPVIVTFLLICLSAISIYPTPLITGPLYTMITLIIVVHSYGVLHNWSTMSATLLRSWVVTHVSRLCNRLLNDYNVMSFIEESWELFMGG